jgi:uncharacterized protein (TIGR00255 family)
LPALPEWRAGGEARKQKETVIRSMTGYGQAEGLAQGKPVRVEISTVNNRFLTIEPDVPASLDRYRSPLEAIVRSSLKRGTVKVRIYLAELNGNAFEIDEECLEHYWRTMSETAARLGLSPGADIGQLAGLPGVVRPKPRVSATEEQWAAIAPAVEAALQALVEDRTREGRLAGDDLDRLTSELKRLLGELREILPGVDGKRHERYRERIENVAKDLVTEEIVAREAAVLSERHDISEEMHRLGAHLEEFRRLLGEGGPVGKKMEFLSQEMHRETVTICNKADDVAVSRVAMEIRAGVQTVREMVMNVE